jgi:hypothetical protein
VHRPRRYKGVRASSLRTHDSNTGRGDGADISRGSDMGRGCRGLGVLAIIDTKGTGTFGGGAGGLTGLGASGSGAEDGGLDLLVQACPREGGDGLHNSIHLL